LLIGWGSYILCSEVAMNSYDTYPKCLEAIRLISEGRTHTVACGQVGITVAAFRKHCKANEELGDALAEADQLSYDAMVDALLEPDAHPLYGSTDAKVMSIVSKNIQWLVARRDPKRYGERMSVDVNVTADKAITNALMQARRRAIGTTTSAPIIDAEVVEDVGDDVSHLLGFDLSSS